MNKLFRFAFLNAFLTVFISTAYAQNAEEEFEDNVEVNKEIVEISTDTPIEEDIFLEMTEPVVLEELENSTGLGGIFDITNNSELNAILTNNDASGAVTGYNVIDEGSFNEAKGVFSIIQNTGNNVIIQDNTIITITVVPGGPE